MRSCFCCLSCANSFGVQDDQRNKLCPLPPKQLRDVANVCNRYPNLDVEYEVEEPDAIRSGESFTVRVSIERDEDEDEDAVRRC